MILLFLRGKKIVPPRFCDRTLPWLDNVTLTSPQFSEYLLELEPFFNCMIEFVNLRGALQRRFVLPTCETMTRHFVSSFRKGQWPLIIRKKWCNFLSHVRTNSTHYKVVETRGESHFLVAKKFSCNTQTFTLFRGGHFLVGWLEYCQVPIWLSPRPSRSVEFVELSETGSNTNFRLGSRDPETIDRGEKVRPGN